MNLRQLTRCLGNAIRFDISVGTALLGTRHFLNHIQPAKRVLDLHRLDALQCSDKLVTDWPDLIATVSVNEFVVLGVHGDGFDRHKSGGSTGCHDLGELGDLLVWNLKHVSIMS